MALAAPVAGLRIVSGRALLVAIGAAPVGIAAALLLGLPLQVALGWLLPGLALSTLVLLAGTTRVDPALVAGVLGAAWAVAVARPLGHPPRLGRRRRRDRVRSLRPAARPRRRRRCPRPHRLPPGVGRLPEVRMTVSAVTGLDHTVEVTGLTKAYGRPRAVDDLDLAVGSGVVGLLGPNGAGKTTLLRMLATVLAPDRGRISLLGRDPAVGGERLEIRRRLGYLPQSPRCTRRSRRWSWSTTWPSSRSTPTVTGAGARRPGCSRRSASPTGCTARSVPCPAACASGWPWPRPFSATRSCWSSTSRPPGSTPSSASSSARCWPPAPAAAPSCSPRTTPPRSPRCASGSSSCAPAASCSPAPRPSSATRRPAGSGRTTYRTSARCAAG